MRRRHSSSVAQAALSMGTALIARCTAASNATSRRVSNGTRSAGGTPQRHSSGAPGISPSRIALNGLLTPARRYQISSISIELADFICRPSARQTSLIATIGPSISACVRLLLTYRVAQLGSLAPIAEVTLPSSRSLVPLVPKRSEHGAPLLCEREPRPKIVFDETFIATALTVSTVMPAFAHSVPVTMLRPETPAYLSKYRKYRAIRQFHLTSTIILKNWQKFHPPDHPPSRGRNPNPTTSIVFPPAFSTSRFAAASPARTRPTSICRLKPWPLRPMISERFQGAENYLAIGSI
jgi:hypothetical protein